VNSDRANWTEAQAGAGIAPKLTASRKGEAVTEREGFNLDAHDLLGLQFSKTRSRTPFLAQRFMRE
jgi:hypothetical protein